MSIWRLKPPAVLPRELIYCRVPLLDGAGNSPASLLAAVELVALFVAQHVPALAACSGGMSRSPCIVAAALAKVRGIDLDEGLQTVLMKGSRDISAAFWTEVKGVLAGA